MFSVRYELNICISCSSVSIFIGLKLVPPVVSIHASGPYIMKFLRRSGRESRLYFTVPNNKLDIQT
jgi:hypothetical protein